MSKPTRLEINCETGEETVYELTDLEIAEAEEASATALLEYSERLAAAEAEAEAKASGLAKLLALGLTEAEANALIK